MDETIKEIDKLLQKGEKWEDIAKQLKIPLSTIYTRVKIAGYKTGKRLVPIRAKKIN